MNTLDAIRARRAIKHYDADHKMSEADERSLLEHAMLSPTSFNIQNWRFVVVKDEAQRADIRKAAWDQAQITDASLLLVLVANTKSWEQDVPRYWKDAPKEVGEMMIGMTKSFYEGKEQLQRDEAMRSVGIAAQTIMLGAQALGYDSCPMIGFDPDAVAASINLPEDHVVGMIVVVGKRASDPHGRNGQLSFEEVVIENSF
jgi:nitroreductase